MLFGLFLTLGVAVLSIALRSYQTSFAQKVGALGILVASFLAVYFITNSLPLGIVAALSWLFLPWLEILTRIRGRSRAGNDLSERATRPLVLLSSHFLPRPRRHHLDDVELSPLLRPKVDAALSH